VHHRNALLYPCSVRQHEALGWNHTVEASSSVFVHNNEVRTHESAEVIGDAFEEDCSDCHVTTAGNELVLGEDSEF